MGHAHLASGALSLHCLLIHAAAGVLGFHRVRKLWRAGEGLIAEGLKGIITVLEGQVNCSWSLGLHSLTGEATVSRGSAVTQQLVILV